MRRIPLLLAPALCAALLAGCSSAAADEAPSFEESSLPGAATASSGPATDDASEDGSMDGKAVEEAVEDAVDEPGVSSAEEAALPLDQTAGKGETLAAWLDAAPRSLTLSPSSIVVFPGEDASLVASVKDTSVVTFVPADSSGEGSTVPGLIPTGAGQTRVTFASPYSGSVTVLVRVS